jgi:hypothetical protein
VAPVYSTRFLTERGLSGSSSSITVPAGHVYVVKSVTFYASSTASTITGFLEDDVTGAALYQAQITTGLSKYDQYYGAIVFEAGMGFHLRVDAGVLDAADMSVSGYDLTN